MDEADADGTAKNCLNNYYSIWEVILDLTHVVSFTVQHVFREGNLIADHLAKAGAARCSSS